MMIDVSKAFCVSNTISNNTGCSGITRIWHNGDIELRENA